MKICIVKILRSYVIQKFSNNPNTPEFIEGNVQKSVQNIQNFS